MPVNGSAVQQWMWDTVVGASSPEKLACTRMVIASKSTVTRVSPVPGDAPVPGAPPEEGLLGRLTDARIGGDDRDAFYLAVEANRRAEAGSGGAR